MKVISLITKNRCCSFTECAQRIKETLERLSYIDDKLKTWYKTDKPKKNEIVAPIDYTKIDVLENLILEGRNINKDTKEVYEELGSLIILKSEKQFKKSIALRFSCCTKANSFYDGVTLFDPLFTKELELSQEKITQIIAIFKDIWKSDIVEIK